MDTKEPTVAASRMVLSSMNTWSPIVTGKKAIPLSPLPKELTLFLFWRGRKRERKRQKWNR
jgi:hypothetical protein